MPTPIKTTSDNVYPMKVDKDNLANRSQYECAVSMIAGRMLQYFGLQVFLMTAMRTLRTCIRVGGDLDGRKTEVKRLQAAEDALFNAAHEYDEAVRAVRDSFTKKSRG